MFGNNKQLEFDMMNMKRDLEDLRRENQELKAAIEAINVPDVEKEGRSWFANKMTERMVYAAAGTILMAAVASFVGGVPWLG